jgi:chorismate dehydratase
MTGTSSLYRLGAVSFLNTVPLIDWFYTEGSDRVLIQRDLPSRLAIQLEQDEVDVALLPVVEIFRGRSGGMLPGVGIAGFGNVDTVKLWSHGPMESLSRIYTDRGSRSSVALLQVLFGEMFDRCPDLVETEPVVGKLLGQGEGLLVIGDRCFGFEKYLKSHPCQDLWPHDLGEMWTSMTGLPFVFAAWAVSPRFVEAHGEEGVSEVKELLQASLSHGLDNLPGLAKIAASQGHLGYGGDATPQAIEYYFRESLRYRLGHEEMAGLLRFQELCFKQGLVKDPAPLKLL